jgi:hypothetical protein
LAATISRYIGCSGGGGGVDGRRLGGAARLQAGPDERLPEAGRRKDAGGGPLRRKDAVDGSSKRKKTQEKEGGRGCIVPLSCDRRSHLIYAFVVA